MRADDDDDDVPSDESMHDGHHGPVMAAMLLTRFASMLIGTTARAHRGRSVARVVNGGCACVRGVLPLWSRVFSSGPASVPASARWPASRDFARAQSVTF